MISDYYPKKPVTSYFNSFKTSAPFFSLQQAIRINSILQGKKTSELSALTEMILEMSDTLFCDSALLPALYSLSNYPNLIVMDEPFTYLEKEEQIMLTKILLKAA